MRRKASEGNDVAGEYPRRPLRSIAACAALAVLTLLAGRLHAEPREPRPNIHPEFPIRERGNLSPPIVDKPIHQCAAAVHVSGAMPHAEITVYANGNEAVGTDTLWVGAGDIQLTRALKVGETVTATQTVNGITSLPSLYPVPVTEIAANALGKPEVSPDIWSCGIVVPVGKLTPSASVLVFEDGQAVGSGNVTGDWLPVLTQPLVANRTVRAQQVMCPNDPPRRIVGLLSDPPVPVKSSPNPPPAPTVIPGSVIPGKDTVDVDGLHTGAEVIVRDRGSTISSGTFATGTANWVPVAPAPVAVSKVDAAQKLCSPSAFGPVVDPVNEIREPVLMGPICDGQQFVVIRKTMLGANVVVFANGGIVGYGGGTGDVLVLALGRPLRSSPQDHVVVRQYYGSLISAPSNTVDVVGGVRSASIEIEGGDPFFIAEPGEEQIDGPVFPRGRGPGPLFRIQTCCREGIRAEILVPNGVEIATLPLEEVFPGYFVARWDWTSRTHWEIPRGIGVGAYTIRVTSNCRQEVTEARFYVIFDPAEVDGSARFSFDETAIWFAAGTNADAALSYTLHPDDARIFKRAIDAVPGEPSVQAAALKIAKAEAKMFAYSVSKSDFDTLELLKDTLAQCADDAGMLTALLRAVGIPAHPVTADAASETGFEWGFDTWVEFLGHGVGAPEWKVIHPHWPDNNTVVGPSTRTHFGNGIGVAKKSANDIVFMAGPDWQWNDINDNGLDVTFARQSCGEPHQALSSKPWLQELCEAGYWAPTTHWACPGGTGSSSSGLSIERSPTVNFRDRTVSGEVRVSAGAKPLRGRHVIELVADLPETKIFGDRVLGRIDAPLRIGRRSANTQPFSFSWKEELLPGEKLHLRLVKGKTGLAAAELPIAPPLALEAEPDVSLLVGDAAEIVVSVRNDTTYEIGGIRLALEVPGPVEAKLSRESIESIRPGETARLTIAIRGKSPLDAGGLVIKANSPAGAARIRIPVRVLDSAVTGEVPLPATWKKQR